MLSKSLITLYINICKITKLILVTQHTYKYANTYIYMQIECNWIPNSITILNTLQLVKITCTTKVIPSLAHLAPLKSLITLYINIYS